MDALRISSAPRRLGPSPLEAFPIAYGCWRFAGTDVDSAARKLHAALDAGIQLFDHADIYGDDGAAEALFGRVLARDPGLRPRMLVATKCGIVPGIPYDSSREHILRSAEHSLRRLQTDVIDLYQIHRPDRLAHPAEIAAALAQLRDEGKIREVGVSNYEAHRLAALQAHLPFPIATTQPELSPWTVAPIDDGTLEQCMQLGVTPLAWSPLAGGRLGLDLDAARAEPDAARLVAVLEALDAVAEREETTRTAVALAFLLAHPAGVIPIIGTQREERIGASVAALQVRMDRRDWYRIFAAALGAPLP